LYYVGLWQLAIDASISRKKNTQFNFFTDRDSVKSWDFLTFAPTSGQV